MKYRAIFRGYRYVGDILARCGTIIEKWDCEKNVWIYYDTLPPDIECVKSLVKNSNGTLTIINYVA